MRKLKFYYHGTSQFSKICHISTRLEGLISPRSFGSALTLYLIKVT